jgi:nucleoside 2-deoxyribosyltransferase
MRRRIYCAGPLFNPKEREEMQEIAEAIESCNVSTFLPQRDGIKYADLIEKFRNSDLSNEEADKILKKIIFYLDIYHVMEKTHALVLNLNGRVPDEGAVVEAALSWMSGKTVFIYKTDDRSLINGTDNPLVLGLNDFDVIRSKEELKVRVGKSRKNKIQASPNI